MKVYIIQPPHAAAITLLLLLYTTLWIPAAAGEWRLLAGLAIVWAGGILYCAMAARGRARGEDALIYPLLLLAAGAYIRSWAEWYSYSPLPPGIYATGLAAALASIPYGKPRAGMGLAAIQGLLTLYTLYIHLLYKTSTGYDFGLDILVDIAVALGAGLGYGAYLARSGPQSIGILLVTLIIAPPLAGLHLTRASLLLESILLLALLARGLAPPRGESHPRGEPV